MPYIRLNKNKQPCFVNVDYLIKDDVAYFDYETYGED